MFGLNFLLHMTTALFFQLSPSYFSPREEVLFLCQLLPEDKLRHSEVYLNKTAGLTKCSVLDWQKHLNCTIALPRMCLDFYAARHKPVLQPCCPGKITLSAMSKRSTSLYSAQLVQNFLGLNSDPVIARHKPNVGV